MGAQDKDRWILAKRPHSQLYPTPVYPEHEPRGDKTQPPIRLPNFFFSSQKNLARAEVDESFCSRVHSATLIPYLVVFIRAKVLAKLITKSTSLSVRPINILWIERFVVKVEGTIAMEQCSIALMDMVCCGKGRSDDDKCFHCVNSSLLLTYTGKKYPM